MKWALPVVLGLSSAACSYARIGAGEVGVVRTPSGVAKRVYPTGDWTIGPWDSPTKYSVRSQERGEQLEVLASNGLRIVIDASIRYHAIASEAVALDQELGPDYYSILLGPTLRSQARRVVGRFQPEEIYSTQREKIEREIREGIDAAIKGRHVVLEAVLIRNVRLPESIQAAINNKLEAEQAALKMKYVLAEAEAEDQKRLAQVKAQAERERITAQSQADAVRLAAQAAADAQRTDGQGTADYERLVQEHLSPQILRLREIEATKSLGDSPSSKLIFMGSGVHASPLIDLRAPGKSDAPYP